MSQINRPVPLGETDTLTDSRVWTEIAYLDSVTDYQEYIFIASSVFERHLPPLRMLSDTDPVRRRKRANRSSGPTWLVVLLMIAIVYGLIRAAAFVN